MACVYTSTHEVTVNATSLTASPLMEMRRVISDSTGLSGEERARVMRCCRTTWVTTSRLPVSRPR